MQQSSGEINDTLKLRSNWPYPQQLTRIYQQSGTENLGKEKARVIKTFRETETY